MKWDIVGIQGIKNSSDIDLGPAGDTEMDMGEFQIDKLLYNLEDLLAFCLNPWIWALVECIHNNVEWSLPLKCKNLFQTLSQCEYAGLSGAISMGQIDGWQNLGEFIGLGTKLEKNRRQQVAHILFGGIPETKIEDRKHG